jgi:hypothetical protein
MSLHKKLARKYEAPAWALFFEVGNGTGSALRRYADAVAVSLFPSRGIDLHGFEVKTHRSDWLNELKKPEKADAMARYMDYWWVVAPSLEVVKKDELPRQWGLQVLRGEDLVVVKQAARLEPLGLDRKILAALCRRAHEQSLRGPAVEQAAEALAQVKTQGLEDELKRVKGERTTDLTELRLRVDQFESRSGIRIDTWDAGPLGDAVKKFLHAREVDDVALLLEATQLRKMADALAQEAQKLREIREQAMPSASPKGVAEGL